MAPNTHTLRAACQELANRDPALQKAYAAVDLPKWRERDAEYESLARIVVYQLISTKAADAIWARVLGRFDELTAPNLLAEDPEALLACGLSRPKLGHLQAIAQAVVDGTIDFAVLADMPIADARKQLISVRGIGPWTADTFLMTSLGHMDAFPHGDVGLMEAYKRLSLSENRLESKAFSLHAETWRPYRAVAAHLLYDWLNAGRA